MLHSGDIVALSEPNNIFGVYQILGFGKGQGPKPSTGECQSADSADMFPVIFTLVETEPGILQLITQDQYTRWLSEEFKPLKVSNLNRVRLVSYSDTVEFRRHNDDLGDLIISDGRASDCWTFYQLLFMGRAKLTTVLYKHKQGELVPL